MTLGNASPAKVAIGTQRMPSGARVRPGAVAVYTTSSSGKWVKTWVTTPALRCQRDLVVLCRGPVRARYFGHAAEQASLRARTHQQFVAARDDEGRAAPQRTGLFCELARKRFLIAAGARDAIFTQRTEHTSRLLR